jgi:anti-anti-sigma regulatory factor
MDKTIDLAVSTEEWEGWRIVRFSGNFIVNSLSLARTRFDEIESGQNQRAALDLTLVTGFDAAAMSIILNFNQKIVRKSGIVVVIGPNEKVRETFARLGFDTDVQIFDTFDLFRQSLPLP